MIYRLQKKLIRICGIAVLIVCLFIFLLIAGFHIKQLNETMDTLTDRISENDGKFPEWKDDGNTESRPFDKMEFMTPETPFSTRFFTAHFDENGAVTAVDITSISSITEEEAKNYALKIYEKGKKRGWVEDYRYKLYSSEDGDAVVCVDGSMNRFMSKRLLLSVGAVLVFSALSIWLIVIFFSRNAVWPVAQSYEKQKQFITDANHELKTPLTLIMTNIDILESEIGENEWLSDMRSEGERMSTLVNRLVLLARMDEDKTELEMRKVSLSDVIISVVQEFQMLSEDRKKPMKAQMESGIECMGDEESIRQVVSILMDNAIKYCDEGGDIFVKLEKRKNPVLYVENTYKNINEIELDRLFDRFYRADKARTYTGGFGVGLSIAKAIITKQKGTISVYKKDDTHIGFKVIWR